MKGPNGHIYYPCQYCNKVFTLKKSRNNHLRYCPEKDYILSVNGVQTDRNIPIKKPNNIILKEHLNEQILKNDENPPIKLTIRRSPKNGISHFTVISSLVLSDDDNRSGDFSFISKHYNPNFSLNKEPNLIETKKVKQKETDCSKKLNNTSENSVNLCKRLENENTTSVKEVPTVQKKMPRHYCKQCKQEFETSLILLRHSRETHSYPRILMAMSEIKKFYRIEDRSVCPICRKPLRSNFMSAFTKHLHTHANDMRYGCQVCKKKFRRPDHMKAHEKRHVIKQK